MAEWLASLGLRAWVLHYRVAPWRHPVPLADLQRGIRLLRHHARDWRVDPNHIAVLGFSAGGHLAACGACLPSPQLADDTDPVDRHSSRVDAALLIYPVLSFGPHRHEGSRRSLLGPERRPDLETLLSLDRQVTRATPPSFVVHSADDRVVPVAGSLAFATACARHDVPCSLHVFPTGGHGAGMARSGAGADPQLARWTDLAADWLAGLGWPISAAEISCNAGATSGYDLVE